ncbi:SRSF protein kinase 3-like [Condylostylus longicornis]|uniref:SRSF protein kinase 3-like n=1 Tax=Condylostylus longicornis TaxID=2530218 RepID=UPI00244DF352|nr:SRSF protein kinase 3-like [Condylostylus longicornis]
MISPHTLPDQQAISVPEVLLEVPAPLVVEVTVTRVLLTVIPPTGVDVGNNHSFDDNGSIESRSVSSGRSDRGGSEGSSANQDDGSEQDFTESDDEGTRDYKKGGYHPVTIGEIYNHRYRIEAKLGWGHFSTVWLATDLKSTECKYVAIKFQKSARHYSEAAYDEIELLTVVRRRSELVQWGGTGSLIFFEHCGPNGTHVCMVFEVMGPNLLSLIKQYNFDGVPIDLVRKIAAHLLVGLDYLHRFCGIIHTDLKPENVLVTGQTLPPPLPLTSKDQATGGLLSKSTSLQTGISSPQSSPKHLADDHTMFELGKDIEEVSQEDESSSIKRKRLDGNDEKRDVECNSSETEEGQIKEESMNEREEEYRKKRECIEKTEQTGTLEGVNDKRKESNSPPFVRHRLKPRGSDPHLLSTYCKSGNIADDEYLYTRPPHHYLAYRRKFPNEFRTGVGETFLLPYTTYLDSDEEDSKNKPSEKTPVEDVALHADVTPPLSTRRDGRTSRTPPQKEESEEAVPDRATLSTVMTIEGPVELRATDTSYFLRDECQYKIADLGNGCWIDKHFSADIQTRQYRSPEVLVGAEYDTSADMWSFACTVFELITGDYLFEPKGSESYSRDEDHLALIIELLGSIPMRLINSGRYGSTFFDSTGHLRNIHDLNTWGLISVLQKRYKLPPREAENLADFLLPMLALDPTKRATAQEMLKHPWLRIEGMSKKSFTRKVRKLSQLS